MEHFGRQAFRRPFWGEKKESQSSRVHGFGICILVCYCMEDTVIEINRAVVEFFSVH